MLKQITTLFQSIIKHFDQMPTIKEQLIKRFKDYCLDPNNDETRKHAVESQLNRFEWNIDDGDGDIKISMITKKIGIEFWLNAWFWNTGAYGQEITEEEFHELRKMYFGNYVPDQEYLKKAGL